MSGVTTAVQWRGGWILVWRDTLSPASVTAQFDRVFGRDPIERWVELSVLVGGTLTVAQTIQQYESLGGQMLCPVAVTLAELNAAADSQGIPQPTAFTSLTPLPAIYSGGGSGDATSIQGVPVSTAAPAVNDVLTYNGAEWEPAPAQVTVADNVANVLFALTPSSVAQFDATPLEIDSPVNPVLTVTMGVPTVSMDVGSGVGATVIYWVTTPIPWNRIRSVELLWTIFGAGPVDDYSIGVVVAADDALGTGLMLLQANTSVTSRIQVRVLNGLTAPATPIDFATQLCTTSLLTTTMVTQTTNTATFAPNGVPVFFGAMGNKGSNAGAANGLTAPVLQFSGYAGTQWGPATLTRVGLALYAPNGVADPAGMLVGVPSMRILGEGAP